MTFFPFCFVTHLSYTRPIPMKKTTVSSDCSFERNSISSLSSARNENAGVKSTGDRSFPTARYSGKRPLSSLAHPRYDRSPQNTGISADGYYVAAGYYPLSSNEEVRVEFLTGENIYFLSTPIPADSNKGTNNVWRNFL